jgi:hypothetical protein
MKGATARGVTQVVWSEREVEFKAAVLEALIRSLQLSLVCNMAINVRIPCVHRLHVCNLPLTFLSHYFHHVAPRKRDQSRNT